MKKTEHFENDDGTCETCIEIGYENALKEVEKEINEIKNEMSENSRFEFERILLKRKKISELNKEKSK